MKKLLSIAVLALSACTPKTTSETGSAIAPETNKERLVVYSGRSQALVGPVLKQFAEANPDIELDIRYNKTPALANQVKAEGKACPADILWFQDSAYLAALASELNPLPEPILSRVDPRFKAADGTWVGVTGRLRVLVYDQSKLKPEALPKSLKGLSDPKWKGKLGWAPRNASFQAHVSALRKIWGEAETKAWLEGMKANEPTAYPKNSPQVRAAHSGEIEIGWVNHYYLHKLKQDGFRSANYSFPVDGDAGNVLMLSGAAVRKASKNQAAAMRLLTYLLDQQAQQYFSHKAFEYPTVPGVKTHADVAPLGSLKLATIEQKHLSDISGTIKLLREVGLN